jgi:hypothetical protein
MTPNARDRPSAVKDSEYRKSTGPFKLSQSMIIATQSPCGVVARIEHTDTDRPNPEYAGPIPQQTLAALAEVSENGC